MGKQSTEMLKGTLECIVLAVLSGRSAHGYEITAWLRDQGFTDIAEGTVYALLIRVEQQPGGDAEQQAAMTKVIDALGDGFTQRRVEVVGPAVSSELRTTGTLAVLASIAAIILYVWFRFEREAFLAARQP